MNVNELADGILAIEKRIFLTKKEHQLFQNSATMLRQQQERIKQLEETQEYLYKTHDADKAEIEALKAENKFFKDLMSDVEILRKASEKCNHSNFVKTEHLTGEGAMEYVEWFDNTCSDCGKHWTTNN